MSSSAPCVVLVSGGLDSATLLALMRAEGRPLYALSFDYGQRHREELVAAGRQCAAQGVRQHLVVPLDLRSIEGSALTSAAFDVPKDRTDDQMTQGIPVTYVPARNTVFLSIALGWAESVGCHDLVIGVNALDQGGYPDCRPPFIEAFERLAQVATRSGVEGSGRWRVHAPLIRLTKAEIIRRGTELGVDFSLTHSCYDPVAGGLACGRCDACQLRLAGFAAAGLVDPVPYAPR